MDKKLYTDILVAEPGSGSMLRNIGLTLFKVYILLECALIGLSFKLLLWLYSIAVRLYCHTMWLCRQFGWSGVGALTIIIVWLLCSR